MYHFIEDKTFLKQMRAECSDIVNRLVQSINREDYLEVEMQLVGSGAKNLETQNNDLPIDLDYNLNIVGINGDINNCRKIKEYIRKKFNEILQAKDLGTCKDSTSVLTTDKLNFTLGNQTQFSIDLAIVRENDTKWYRLIHEKTGNNNTDRWFWNEGQQTKGLTKKVNYIKEYGKWNLVRNTYLDKKNMYLKRRDNSHPSFNCYIEAVNEIYNNIIL